MYGAIVVGVVCAGAGFAAGMIFKAGVIADTVSIKAHVSNEVEKFRAELKAFREQLGSLRKI